MKIAILTEYPPKQSGIGTYSSYLVKGFERNEKVKVLEWNFSNKLIALFAPLFRIFKLNKALKENDILHVQYHLGTKMPLFLPVLWLLKIGKKCKVILTLHEDYRNLRIYPIIRLFHNLFYNAADKLIIHISATKEGLSERLKKKCVLIPHGVIFRKKVDRRPKRNQILLPGFINPWKGHDLAIEAMRDVVKEIKDAKLIIAGRAYDGKYSAKIQKMIKKHDLGDKIIFMNKYIPEEGLFELMKTSDISVLPYRRITMSGILCHILSWNCPTIMSDLKEFVEFTKSKGVYFKKEDTQDLSRKMVSLLKDEKMKKKIEKDFNELAKEYSWEKTAKKHLAVYMLEK